MEDAVDRYGVWGDVEGDFGSPLEPEQSQAGSDVIAKHALLWEGGEIGAALLKSRDVREGRVGSASEKDVSMELLKVIARFRREDDLACHGLAFSRSAWCARIEAKTSSAAIPRPGSSNMAS